MKFNAFTRATPSFYGWVPPQILLVMKLTTLLLIIGLLQVSAKGFSQKINLNETNAPLEEVLSAIKQQSGYVFLFTDQQLKKITVSVQIENATIEETLTACFKNLPVNYKIVGNNILLKPADPGSPGTTAIIPPLPVTISGRVTDSLGAPLAGATISNKKTGKAVSADGKGEFSISAEIGDQLTVTFVGYNAYRFTVTNNPSFQHIALLFSSGKLNEVVVSTGYQTVPKERATGSFEKVNNALFNRATGPDVIARLEGIVPGLLFNKTLTTGGYLPGINELTIRGQSTLIANKQPLVVVDNFPYDGDVTNINPNDVESITVLKDAAAASIWGIRAGNGVIVITTKKGAYDKLLQVSLNANITVAGKPNLFYLPQMNTSDFIGVEKFLFAQGYYDSQISDTFTLPLLSPVVGLLGQQRAGTISAASANAQIAALGQYDVRNDYLKYVYRKPVNQQYALNLNGGSKTFNYIFSAGYDNDLSSTVKTGNDRITLRTDLAFKPLKNLEINAGSSYTQANNYAPGNDLAAFLRYGNSIPPYTRLADDQGNPLVVGRDYLSSFAANPGDPRLLNWQFKPLAELNDSKNTTTNYDWLLNLAAKYQLVKSLGAEVKYQYERTLTNNQDWEGIGSYYTRNLVNSFTQPVGAAVARPVPAGGVLDQGNGNFYSYTLRGQLDFDQTWGSKHRLTAIAGTEVKESSVLSNSFRTYGYNNQNLAYQPVDNTTFFGGYLPQQGGTIPNGISFINQINRYTSLYTNMAYTYDSRYTFSASARKDASNIFGVNANHRGVPLWSAGAAWNISHESFYNADLLPNLKLRATYGYNGNANNQLSAFSVISYRGAAPYSGLPNAVILNAANADLSWEKVGIMNLGLDFGFRNDRLTGSLEYFTKKSTGVIYGSPLGLSTGFTVAPTNSVDLSGKGVDLSLHALSLRGVFNWNTDFILSYNTSRVTRYVPVNPVAAGGYLSAANTLTPLLGEPLYAVYAYKSAGLDPQTGDPQGYVAGKVSKDYASLVNAPVGDLQYFGSGVPLFFGGLRNTFNYKNFSISANITYKFDYYFRRTGLNYGALFNGGGNADYAKRWQKPGDEQVTNVPSMVYPDNNQRDQFYAYSAALIDKGDHIRLQDITAGYTLKSTRYFKSLRLYANAGNLWVLWRANKDGIDPDYGNGYPAPLSLSFGLNANF